MLHIMKALYLKQMLGLKFVKCSKKKEITQHEFLAFFNILVFLQRGLHMKWQQYNLGRNLQLVEINYVCT